MDGPPEPVRVLPDGCMDLIEMSGRIVVAGPDTTAFVSPRGRETFTGLRFRPGVRCARDDSLAELATVLAAGEPARETTPWSLRQLRHITESLRGGAAVADVARDTGWSNRTLQRQCTAVYG